MRLSSVLHSAELAYIAARAVSMCAVRLPENTKLTAAGVDQAHPSKARAIQ